MNYRHIFHAGNFADCMKHALLARIITYLKQKDKAFRVIDTHAGTGLYPLNGKDALRTSEWQDGIEKVLSANLSPQAAKLLAPWLDCVRDLNNEKEELQFYPGSPKLIRHLLRKQDRLTAIELHEGDYKTLKKNFADDFQSRILNIDGWLALGAQVPVKEKRGLVLVDPPFEERDEFGTMISGLVKAYKRWPTGIYALWYPIKPNAGVEKFRNYLKLTGITDIMDITLTLPQSAGTSGLNATGLVVINAPYVLRDEANIILPALGAAFSPQGYARFSCHKIA